MLVNSRLRMAFDLALQHFQIDQLLDPEDVNTNKPDKKSILMYVMCLYHAIESKKFDSGSIQNLVQHYGGSNDEIQLLDEKDLEQSTKSGDKTLFQQHENIIDENMSSYKPFHSTFQQQQQPSSTTTFHVGNSTNLDEIPLIAQSDDSANGLQRSATFTIKKEKTEKPVVYVDDNNTEPASAAENRSITPTKCSFFIESSSRPVSTATNVSVEIGGYQNAIECVLTLLLEAEEVLSKDVETVDQLCQAKQQFQDHEEFMIKLSEYQKYVGGALEEGARLMAESQISSGLTLEDQNEIKQQMFLLNERWETLRQRALIVQDRIHSTLAKVQFEKIEELRLLLTNTEDRISRIQSVGTTEKDIQLQIDEHMDLERSLDDQKSLVDELSNLVVIVNDDSFSDLEDKLAALGERWSHVVKWTKNRWSALQDAATKSKELTNRYHIICRWIDVRESNLKQMEGNEVTEIGSVMKRMNDLRYCCKDLEILAQHLTVLEQTAQSIGSEMCETYLENIENIQDRYEALKLILDVQKSRIEGMGFKFPKFDNDATFERPDSWYDFQRKILLNELESNDDETISSDSESLSPQSSKKRKLHKPSKMKDFNKSIEQLTNFLNNCETNINDFFNITDINEQSTHIHSIRTDIMNKRQNILALQEIFNECESELTTDDRLHHEAEQNVNEIASKYDEIINRLKELNEIHEINMNRDKFYKNLTEFKLVLADCRDWYKQHANTASIDDLTSQLNYMQSFSFDIEKSNIICQSDMASDLTEWKQDFVQFFDSWLDMKQAISRIIEEKSKSSINNEQLLSTDENRNVNDILRRLEDFICETEECNVVITTMELMTENLAKLNDLQTEYKNLHELHEFVADRISQSSANNDLMDVWSKLPNFLNDKIIKQTTAIENLNHFNSEYEMISKCLKTIDNNLSQDCFIPGEIKALRQTSEKFDKYATDIKKVEIDIISLKNFCEIMQKDSEIEHKDYLVQQIKNINNIYAKIVECYQENMKKLKQVTKQTEDILEKIDTTHLWLNDLKLNTPTIVNSEILNSNELFQIKTKFQSLKETCEQRTIMFRELNETGSDLLLHVDDIIQKRSEHKHSYLAKQFTKLNAYWNQVTSLVYNRTALLEHISSQLGEFKTLVVSETGYLDKLEKCLRKSPENAADSEEIYEELDVRKIEIF